MTFTSFTRPSALLDLHRKSALTEEEFFVGVLLERFLESSILSAIGSIATPLTTTLSSKEGKEISFGFLKKTQENGERLVSALCQKSQSVT